MARPMTVSDSVLIAADAQSLYDEVSDPSRMGEWSPENRGADIAEPGRPAYVGMTFVGHNKRGRARWQTRCTVTAADPGRRFEFHVHRIGVKVPVIPSLVRDRVETVAQVHKVGQHDFGLNNLGFDNVGVDPAAGVDLPEQVHLQRNPWAQFVPDDRARGGHGPHAAL